MVRHCDPGKGCALLRWISEETLGLDDARMSVLCAAAGKIIHCARHQLRRTQQGAGDGNQREQPARPVDLCCGCQSRTLYYVSTAYAAGMRDGMCMETPITTDSFTNVYEEKKAQAEGVIGRYCETGGCLFPTAVSIVYGHSKTGIALKFNALYAPVKSLLCIRTSL